MDPETKVLFTTCRTEREIADRDAFRTIMVPVAGYNSPLYEEVKRVDKFESKLMRVLNPSGVVSDTHEVAILASKIC